MKFILMALLMVGLLPGGATLVVNGDGPECTATAVGDVETFLVVYYDHDDPIGGEPYSYITPVRLLTSGEASVAYDWGPVAIQWYGKAEDSSRFKLIGGCGSIPPKDITRKPRSVNMIEECPIIVTKPSELYARAYYLHPNPDDPIRRFSYKSEIITTEGVFEEVELNLAQPIAVAWYYRECGSIVAFPHGDWILAKVCGELPVSTQPGSFQSLESFQLFAVGRN